MDTALNKHTDIINCLLNCYQKLFFAVNPALNGEVLELRTDELVRALYIFGFL